MTTVPLSRRIDALFGIRVGAISGPFSPLPVHPESPVLLTKTSPPTIVDFTSGVRSGDPGSLPVRSSRIGRGRYGPGTSSRSLYRSKRFRDGRYPEGNFGGNQLLGGSIGLSPLFARRTNDLHVSTVDGPPPGFPPASPRARIDHHLSGPDASAPARSASRTSGRRRRPPSGRASRHSLSLRGWASRPLARARVRLLGPCFETGRTGPSRLRHSETWGRTSPVSSPTPRASRLGNGDAPPGFGPLPRDAISFSLGPTPRLRRAPRRALSDEPRRPTVRREASPAQAAPPPSASQPPPKRGPGGCPSGNPRTNEGCARTTTGSRRSGPLPP